MKPLITKAPKKTTAKPKLVARPKPKTTAQPAPAPVVASSNGPLNQLPPESPAPPSTELVEPVIQSKPLIITIPPESPAPPVTEEATKVTGYLVVESEVKPQVESDAAALRDGYTVIESEAADTSAAPSTDPVVTPTTPSVPTVTVPPSHALEDMSSIQLGDVLIIAVRVQPKQEPETTG